MSYYRLYNKNNELIKESELFEDISVFLDERWYDYCESAGINYHDDSNFDHLVYMLLTEYRLEEED